MAYSSTRFPAQRIPFKSKGKKWRESCVDFASTRTYFNYTPVRKSVVNMKINHDLVNGKIHMEDVAHILNPGNISTAFLPEKIQHYPIINSKLFTLRGEEGAREFDWHATVVNPSAISSMEEDKRKEFAARLRSIVEDTDISQEEAQGQVENLHKYFKYDYQDIRELRANRLMKHYNKVQNFKQTFNDGFEDAEKFGEEIYHCDIVGCEPVLYKMDPMKLRIFQSGYSDKVEDADYLIYEDYWSPGKIIDTFGDELSAKDVKWLSDEIPLYGGSEPTGAAGNYDDTRQFINHSHFVGEEGIDITGDTVLEAMFDELNLLDGGFGSDLLPYDVAGNVRVLRVWWKSKRLVLKVKSFDPETGEEVFDFYPETYVVNEAAGEEASPIWINEAWEGTKIGEKIYCRIRPCPVQYNTINNPSRCHFGIVGTIYSSNGSKPFSLVDMMKPYSYLYDSIHAKLVDMIATNWGKILELDLALKPKDWEVDKWMYFARANKVLIKDSFNEAGKGPAQGILAANLNNASKGYIDADWGNSMQNYMNLLQWVKDSMSELVGINRQREGNTYSRETVGGIERAVLQSSYITDWLFQKHEDTKRRVLNCFIETAKAAFRGRNKKFEYVLSDGERVLMNIDGDEFSENDYDIVVDSSADTQKLTQNIDSLAQAAIQNQLIGLSSAMKLYASGSPAEKIRTIAEAEDRKSQELAQQQQMQQQMQQQIEQMRQQTELQKMQMQDELNKRDNDTRIKVAELGAQAEYLRLGIYADENNEELRREEMQIDKDKLRQEILEFDKELKFKEKELEQKKEIEMAKIAATKQKQTTK